GKGEVHFARISSGSIIPFSSSSSASSSSGPGSSGSGLDAVIPFKAKMTIKEDDLHKEMFEQSWRSLYDYFYDPKLHGVDWEAVRARYKPLVDHVATKEDLYALLYMMLGELNASHLGVGGVGAGPGQATGGL